jgi:23S rRNA pseudouridine2605 synthase
MNNDKEDITPLARIAKVMSAQGFCSRREAERLVESGKVRVNGELHQRLATPIPIDSVITVEDGSLTAGNQSVAGNRDARPRLWLYHKPVGVITTHRDPQNRPTVFSVLPPSMPRVISVGRLDLNSEGLLLLTTHGGLARYLEHPQSNMLRAYRVRVYGQPIDSHLQHLVHGVTINGVRYRPIRWQAGKQSGKNRWYDVEIQEGKNREIRRVMEYCGLTVNRLIRVQYGPFSLGDLPSGALHELPYRSFSSLINDACAGTI